MVWLMLQVWTKGALSSPDARWWISFSTWLVTKRPKDAWLIHGDFLLAQLPGSFDFVVGNPPYVRQELIPAALLQVNYEKKTKDAVKAFWRNREKARNKQIEVGKIDQGERSGVTGGKNLDGFIVLIRDMVKANGLGHADVHQSRALVTLPGFFRPTKLWDLVVTHKGHLVAAVELKSQIGPSFGNNFNNRAEEAIGTAHDCRLADGR